MRKEEAIKGTPEEAERAAANVELQRQKMQEIEERIAELHYRPEKDAARRAEEAALAAHWEEETRRVFDEREIRLIRNCIVYAEHDPAGLPGHNLMIVVAKLCDWLGFDPFAVGPKGDAR